MTRFLIVFLFQSKYFKIVPPIYDRGTNDQYCQHYITSTYSKISDFIEGMDQNAWCSLCSNKESHCSGEEMLPVRVSADNCRGGAVSSARWLLCYTLVYRQHQENTLLHSTPGPGAAFINIFFQLYLQNPQSIQCDSFLVFCHYNLFCPFWSASITSCSRAVLNADMMIISKHKRHRNDTKHHHLSHLCKTILHHCNSFMSAHSVRRQLSCGRWEETLLTHRQDMGTSVQGFLLSYLSFFNIHWLLILLLIGLITGYFEGRRKCVSGHS